MEKVKIYNEKNQVIGTQNVSDIGGGGNSPKVVNLRGTQYSDLYSLFSESSNIYEIINQLFDIEITPQQDNFSILGEILLKTRPFYFLLQWSHTSTIERNSWMLFTSAIEYTASGEFYGLSTVVFDAYMTQYILMEI